MNRGWRASSPSAPRRSLATRFRFESDTNVPGHSTSWMCVLAIAFGRWLRRRSRSSKAIGSRWTTVPRRVSCRVPWSKTKSPNPMRKDGPGAASDTGRPPFSRPMLAPSPRPCNRRCVGAVDVIGLLPSSRFSFADSFRGRLDPVLEALTRAVEEQEHRMLVPQEIDRIRKVLQVVEEEDLIVDRPVRRQRRSIGPEDELADETAVPLQPDLWSESVG